jgi:ribosome biogenesis GTPase
MSGRPAQASGNASHATQLTGRVVAAHGRHYVVRPDIEHPDIEPPHETLLQCFPRGKRSEIAVGDHVT